MLLGPWQAGTYRLTASYSFGETELQSQPTDVTVATSDVEGILLPLFNLGQTCKHTYESIVDIGNEGRRFMPRVLLVDDNVAVRTTMQAVLESNGFEVVSATSVNDALMHIATATELFDVLLTDLHMPGKSDGLTVASVMRHSNPRAITLVMSGYPQMSAAAAAIVMQADHVLLKPLEIGPLIELIREKLMKRDTPRTRDITETVATILEQNCGVTVQHWLKRVNANEDLTQIGLTDDERTGHLPRLINDLVGRLRKPQSLESGRVASAGAREHGALRRQQGYSAAMIVEESRMLQVSIFQTLQSNLSKVDFSLLLMNVMVVADEVDWQLTQAIRSYLGEQQSFAAA